MAILKKSNFKIIETKVISIKNINNFQLLDSNHIRRLREPKVKQIIKLLKAGKNFDAPIVVTKNGQTTTIDGQHRMTAIRKMIDDDPTWGIEVSLYQYENKNTKEQGILFKNWNSGTPQSTDDFIQMFSTTLPFWNKMNLIHFTQNVGMVSIYPSPDELHFRKWVGSYTAATLRSMGGNSLTNEKFLEVVKRLDISNDYDIFFDMCKDIKNNLPSIFQRGYRYATTTGIAALIYVYYHTVSMGKLDDKKFWKAYHKTVATSEQYYEALGMTGGKATTDATKDLVTLINKGLKKQDQVIVK